MKRILCLIISLAIISSGAYAYNFKDPDWGVLLNERKAMVNQSELDLFVEANPASAPYYGARLEPQSGAYIGMISETSTPFYPVGSYLTYIDNMNQPDLYHPANVMISSDNVVSLIGWTVDDLGTVNYEYIRSVLNNLAAYNKPMFIRFANEMNVSSIGDNPINYVNIFRNVANMVHEYDNFAMVWSPNDLGALNRPYELYYPGDEYVDWVGVSMYMIKYFQGKKNTAYKDSVYFMTGDYAYATNRIKPIVEFMRNNNIQKPLMISEGGVPTNNKFGENLEEWGKPRFDNFLWYLVMQYPQIKMINYFNNHRPLENERYDITGYQYAERAFMRAKESGAYITEYGKEPEFVFHKAENSGYLYAKNGIINLYTYAYFPKVPSMTVTYKLDGEWYHSSNEIPYTCALDTTKLTPGEHTISIIANGAQKSYTFTYYNGSKCINFKHETDDYIKVLINDSYLMFDVPPIIQDGRTLIQMRGIFENLGATVTWDDATKTAYGTLGDTTVSITIGSNQLKVNDKVVTLDVPGQIIDGRTLVPARAISEAFGAKVEWQSETKTVVITK